MKGAAEGEVACVVRSRVARWRTFLSSALQLPGVTFHDDFLTVKMDGLTRMTTVKIDIPVGQAAALRAHAAAQGLTLETWFQQGAKQEARRAARETDERKQHGSVSARCGACASASSPTGEGWTTRDYVNSGRRSMPALVVDASVGPRVGVAR